jgi:hypothetical protein
MVACERVKLTSADLEWQEENGYGDWAGFEINRDVLRKWVTNQIAYRTRGGQIPSRMGKLREHLDITDRTEG